MCEALRRSPYNVIYARHVSSQALSARLSVLASFKEAMQNLFAWAFFAGQRQSCQVTHEKVIGLAPRVFHCQSASRQGSENGPGPAQVRRSDHMFRLFLTVKMAFTWPPCAVYRGLNSCVLCRVLLAP